MKKILFVSHKKTQCGIYEFGKDVVAVLCNSERYEFIKAECSSLDELNEFIKRDNPDAIIYNYYPLTMPWIAKRILAGVYKNNIASIKIPQIGIIHENTQDISDAATVFKNKFLFRNYSKLANSLFDFYIAPDPTLLLKNPFVYKTGRLIKKYQNNFPIPLKPTFGSFGFGAPTKGFENIVELVQQQFDEAIIRLNIPVASFVDKDGEVAKSIEEKCKKLVIKPGIEVIVTHEFLDTKSILDFLAKNTINVFLYKDPTAKGLSSAIDSALSVRRPIAISKSPMFRHILSTEPSICIEDNSLKTIIKNGFYPLQKYHDEWSADNLLWDYERILDSIFLKKGITKDRKNFFRFLKSKIYRLLCLPDKSFTWLRNSVKVNDDNMEINFNVNYFPITLLEENYLNRILDNDARRLYRPAEDKLKELVPITMAKKIPEANVQQAFVFDTVSRFIPQYKTPKLLCVGSYEDTASMALIKMGFKVEEIDPTQNYYLQEYVAKPSTIKNSYDIIFSTSVIEHDPDDESFMRAISSLLSPGGVAVLTCDYKENWKIGDDKPDVDARLYTKSDLENRLLSYMDNCQLVDKPQWDCPNPDFNYLGKYQYTFTTFVVKKINSISNN